MRGLSLDLFFDFLGVRLNGEKAEGKTMRRQLGVPRHRPALCPHPAELRADLSCRPPRATVPTATVTLDRTTLNRIILRELALPEAMGAGSRKIAGNAAKVAELFGLLDDFIDGASR